MNCPWINKDYLSISLTETNGTTETKPRKPPEQTKRKHRNNRTTRKTRRREPQKVPKVIKQTVSITEKNVSSTNKAEQINWDQWII